MATKRNRAILGVAVTIAVVGMICTYRLHIDLHDAVPCHCSGQQTNGLIRTEERPLSLTDWQHRLFLKQTLEHAENRLMKNLALQEVAKARVDCSHGGDYLSCGLFLLHMAYLIPPYQCFKEIRVARWGEGGKWVCDIPNAIPRNSGIIYSVGSNGEIEFEEAMHNEFRVRSFTIDPTLRSWEANKVKSFDFIDFFEIGLAGEDELQSSAEALSKSGKLSTNAKMLTAEGLMKHLNHTYVHVFKIDCEGCERGVLRSLRRSASRERPLFGQILIEYHKLTEQEPSTAMFETMEELGYILFHAEANFYAPADCWEAAYIHESVIARAKI